MTAQNQQIGWSQEAKLLQQILIQLDYLTKVLGNLKITTTTTTTTTSL